MSADKLRAKVKVRQSETKLDIKGVGPKVKEKVRQSEIKSDIQKETQTI